MLSISTLIWVACRPLIRLVFCVSCGIIVTKKDMFPLVAARSVSQIIMNIGYPCLMFSKIIPAFTSDNLRALGPLVLVAVIYILLGTLLGFVVKQLCWVPHRFRYGILMAGAFSNVGDLPTAVALAVTSAAPFNGTDDQNLAVAYIAAFILVFIIGLFPLGGHRMIIWDFTGPDVEWTETKAQSHQKHRRSPFALRWRKPGFKASDTNTTPADTEKQAEEKSVEDIPFGLESSSKADPCDKVDSIPRNDLSKPESTILPIEPSPCATSINSLEQIQSQQSPRPRIPIPPSVINAIKSFFTPPSIAILVAFPIAVIPKLKALFVPVAGSSIPSAPDGQPPLAFLIDATSYVGNAAVPMALICLGSSLARLTIPKRGEWRKLPLGAIGLLAAGKLVLMPVIGVLMCQGLTKAGVIPKEDKVLRFVCIFCSCLPTATTQVFLTQVYSGTGSAEHISVFLIPQYILMFLTMTTLTAYTLHLLS
ncbi:auxin efflux carrier [Crepidotus variabilis]|uniref:Auxin efflux carrier n=1 Tax=Crepidotus variabilis TaxID=179855 RepID=A0A9P6ESC5_9AGAR|nr:auxin efflux carrier [Crepidotus variabilis]